MAKEESPPRDPFQAGVNVLAKRPGSSRTPPARSGRGSGGTPRKAASARRSAKATRLDHPNSPAAWRGELEFSARRWDRRCRCREGQGKRSPSSWPLTVRPVGPAKEGGLKSTAHPRAAAIQGSLVTRKHSPPLRSRWRDDRGMTKRSRARQRSGHGLARASGP